MCYRFPEFIFLCHTLMDFQLRFACDELTTSWSVDTYDTRTWRFNEGQKNNNKHSIKKVQKIKNTYISTLIYNTLNIHYGKQINANWLTGHVTLFLLLSVFIHSREKQLFTKKIFRRNVLYLLCTEFSRHTAKKVNNL